MVSSADSEMYFWAWSKLPVMYSLLLQGAELSDSSIKGLFFFYFKMLNSARLREPDFHLYVFCVIEWGEVDDGAL